MVPSYGLPPVSTLFLRSLRSSCLPEWVPQLFCRVTGEMCPAKVLMLSGERMLRRCLSEGVGDLYQGEGYEGRVDVPEDHLLKGNCSLVLKNVRPEDAGVYESFLLVRRKKRSLRSKRVFLQRVELSVDERPQQSAYEHQTVTDDARVNYPPSKIAVLLFLSWRLFL
ncbi:hypothetical protein MHYP_G00170650 [Metynnis hypsauchen]